MQVDVIVSRKLLITELSKFLRTKKSYILKYVDISARTLTLTFILDEAKCVLKIPVNATGFDKPLRIEHLSLVLRNFINCLNGLTCYYVKLCFDDYALLLSDSKGRVHKRVPYGNLTNVPSVQSEPKLLTNRYALTYESNQQLKGLTGLSGRLCMFEHLQAVYSQSFIQTAISSCLDLMSGDYIGIELTELKQLYQIMSYVDYIDVSADFIVFVNSVLEYCLPNRDFREPLQTVLNGLPCQPNINTEFLYSTLRENNFEINGVSYVNETKNSEFSLGYGLECADEAEASKEVLLQYLVVYKPERFSFSDMPLRVVNASDLSAELSSFAKAHHKGNVNISLGVRGLLFYGLSDTVAEPLDVEVFYRVLEGEREPAVFDCYSVHAESLLKLLKLYGNQKIFIQVIYGYLYIGTDECLSVLPCLNTRHNW